jgi:hypothetical protein
MAEIIQLREVHAARERARRRFAEQVNVERALAIMRGNLADVATRLKDAHADERGELLERVERLTAMIRYGMRMVDEAAFNSTGEVRPHAKRSGELFLIRAPDLDTK